MGNRPSPLSALSPGMVALVEVRPDAYLDDLVAVARELQQGGGHGIVVNVSRPRQTLVDVFADRGLDVDRLHFVDCISRMLQADIDEVEGAIYLDSPTMLEMIAMSVDHVIDEVDDVEFVLFDSYGALITYNDYELVYEFTNFLANKLRVQRLEGVLVVVEDQLPDEIRGSLAQLTDTVVEWRQTDAR